MVRILLWMEGAQCGEWLNDYCIYIMKALRKYMNLKNRVLFGLTERIIERNSKFENIHKGESCYLFGNGASLKYYNLKYFNDKHAIACNSFFLHRDFRHVNVKYYFEGHSFYYYPYWINPYSRKIQKNPMGKFCKEKNLCNDDILFFCNLSNYFGIHGDNIYYAHNFGISFDGFANCKLDGSFTTMSSALSGMLGLAIFMGFEDITLVGCDYSFFPQSQGHFYEYGRFPDTFDKDPNEEFLLDAMQYANVRVITPNDEYRGHILPHVSYKDFTGNESIYKENNEILSDSDLLNLDRFNMKYKIFSK